ncbi:MAG TPA: GMC family oxidoreductase N-terminal domain-containing protein [Streptosporangiaceae bacterium]|nr:GMC family oxidoreductase N-terminal domain-containing protein [Streptosporangiaceae bacterium]
MASARPNWKNTARASWRFWPNRGGGHVLGGSSSINGMTFRRGNPLDYERWAADDGMASWDYAHCLPYFKKMEACLAGGDEFRGTSGPLVLERGPATSPLFGAF